MNRRNAIAQAHAAHRMSIRLTAAHNAVVSALEDERRFLAAKIDDPRNDIAAYRWRISCGVLALALAKLDRAVAEFNLSSQLAKEIVS
jgi:hypothetical protein